MLSSRPRLHVDLQALKQNFATLSALRLGAETAAVVKADAYGLGVTEVALALAEAGCRTFFVAYTFEGVALRAVLNRPEPNARICIFNGPSTDDIHEYTPNSLVPVLNTAEQISLWREAGSGSAMLHVDTGMNRLGLNPEEAFALCSSSQKGLQISHILSHFACSDDPAAPKNEQQLAAFSNTLNQLTRFFPQAEQSISASGGLLLPNKIEEKLSRPGIALYGVSPQNKPDDTLNVVATLQAPVLQLRDIQAGESVGYGATYVAKAPRRLATLAIGYGDGYPRSLSNKGKVWLGGTMCPVVGIVSMDLITVDITDAPEAISVGDMAECLGPNVTISEIAELADTIPYELLVTLGPRIERHYAT